jgi:hypothetical protein
VAPPCSICCHPDRPAIEAAIVAGTSAPKIAAQHGTSPDAVLRHKQRHLGATLVRAAQLVAAVEVEKHREALDVMAELRRLFRHTNLLLDACDAWLRDPADPTRYTLEPRATEVMVVYEEIGQGGQLHRRKAPLDRLLARLAAGEMTAVGYEMKRVDVRELLLKAVGQVRPSIELLAKLGGELEERPVLNLVLTPEWLTLRTALLDVLAPYPEARAAVASRLQALEEHHGHRR